MKASTTSHPPPLILTSMSLDTLKKKVFSDHTSNRGSEGIDFNANLAISSIDFGTFHVSTSSGLPTSNLFIYILSLSRTQKAGVSPQTRRLGELNGSRTMPLPRSMLTSPWYWRNSALPQTRPQSTLHGWMRFYLLGLPGNSYGAYIKHSISITTLNVPWNIKASRLTLLHVSALCVKYHTSVLNADFDVVATPPTTGMPFTQMARSSLL